MSKHEVLNFIESVDALNRKVISFFGPLDENAEQVLKSVEPDGKVLDLSKISRVSTPGAGCWVNWAKAHESTSAKVIVCNVPPNFVRVLNSMPEMIPVTWSIDSFYVPYLRPLTDESENVLFIHGLQFNRNEINLPPLITSLVGGQKLELDVHPEMYFKFLLQRFRGMKLNHG